MIPGGGASAIRFSSTGHVLAAYRVLSGTRANCAGGATPWGRWLSCEQVDRGWVWDTDPTGVGGAMRRDAVGRFKHEAAAVDPQARVVYLTEDEPDGCFYRFRPERWPDLSTGVLEVLTTSTTWARVPDPSGATTRTRHQVAAARHSAGGEGCWYSSGTCWFPDGHRLYFSSQRGASGTNGGGVTYEVRGPFRRRLPDIGPWKRMGGT